MSDTTNTADSYAGRRVLVVGGAGAIGSNLVRALLERDAEVLVLDDMTSGYTWNLPSSHMLLLIKGDLLDETALKRVFSESPAVVFHLAAFFANQNSVDYPERDLMVNGLGTLRLLEYAALKGVERFVYTSSSSVYGDSPRLPIGEDGVSLQLSTPYQVTKLLGEMYGNFYRKQHGLPVVSVRLFNSYGPGEVPGQYRNVVPNFFYWAMSGQSLPITGSGDETRDFTFVGDVVDGLLACGVESNAVGEVMNLAGGREVAIIKLASLVLEITGSTSDIRHLPARKWDTKRRFLADTSKAQRTIGFAPATDFENGLAKTYEWFTSNWENITAAASFGPGASSALRG